VWGQFASYGVIWNKRSVACYNIHIISKNSFLTADHSCSVPGCVHPDTCSSSVPDFDSDEHTFKGRAAARAKPQTPASRTVFSIEDEQCIVYTQVSCMITTAGRCGASLVHFQGIFRISDFFPLDTDNFISGEPWTWRWRGETRVIPFHSESDL